MIQIIFGEKWGPAVHLLNSLYNQHYPAVNEIQIFIFPH